MLIEDRAVGVRRDDLDDRAGRSLVVVVDDGAQGPGHGVEHGVPALAVASAAGLDPVTSWCTPSR